MLIWLSNWSSMDFISWFHNYSDETGTIIHATDGSAKDNNGSMVWVLSSTAGTSFVANSDCSLGRV